MPHDLSGNRAQMQPGEPAVPPGAYDYEVRSVGGVEYR